MSKISLSVQLRKYPSQDDPRTEMELDEHLVRYTYQSLDKPNVRAGFARMLCTDEVTIREVSMERKKLAKYLAEKLTEAILATMESNDTVMGYKT